MKKQKPERIAVMSDGTCDTAEAYVRALLAQFDRSNADLLRFPRIREEGELLAALEKLEPPYLVAYTFATEQLRKRVWSEARKRNLYSLDLLYPAIDVFSQFLHSHPTQQHGALHSTQAVNYYDRMEAIEFTVKHDDGQRMGSLVDAEIILTGVSRTSKTPTSMYLAHKGYRVANVPLVYGIAPNEQLLAASKRGVPVVMLSIDPMNLERIRRARFERLGTSTAQSDTYVDLRRITEEMEAAHRLAHQNKWPIIDVTSKAIEETAAEILLIVTAKL